MPIDHAQIVEQILALEHALEYDRLVLRARTDVLGPVGQCAEPRLQQGQSARARTLGRRRQPLQPVRVVRVSREMVHHAPHAALLARLVQHGRELLDPKRIGFLSALQLSDQARFQPRFDRTLSLVATTRRFGERPLRQGFRHHERRAPSRRRQKNHHLYRRHALQAIVRLRHLLAAPAQQLQNVGVRAAQTVRLVELVRVTDYLLRPLRLPPTTTLRLRHETPRRFDANALHISPQQRFVHPQRAWRVDYAFLFIEDFSVSLRTWR